MFIKALEMERLFLDTEDVIHLVVLIEKRVAIRRILSNLLSVITKYSLNYYYQNVKGKPYY